MGCDGGTIPRRDELVRVKKKAEGKDKDSSLAFQWQCCALTQQPLQKPIVMCGLGRLYNKLCVIEAILNKEISRECPHIKTLKDVKDLKLTPNPAFKEEDKKEGALDSRSVPYICPVIGLEMSGKFRFVGIWTCGCVFSERALKEVKTKNCHKCQKPFDDEDVVVLNGNEADVELMQVRLENRQSKRKDKKTKVKIETETSGALETEPSTSKVDTKPEIKPNGTVIPNGNPAAAVAISISAKRPGAVNVNTNQKDEVRKKKAKSDYSVAKDPGASDVYKSLFTTHKSEQEQDRAHWVTYNPFYN